MTVARATSLFTLHATTTDIIAGSTCKVGAP
jgi:hypothetical protein